VAGWAKPDEFIIAMLVTTAAHAAAAESFRLEWKKGAGGAWNLLQAGAGEIRQGTNTVLINGNALDDTKDSGCQLWADIDASEEVEGDDTTAAASCAKANYMEFQFAVDPSNATEAQDYYFRLYSITGAEALGEAASSITIAGTGTAELLSKLKPRRETYQELGAVFSVAVEDTRDLEAIFRVAQDSKDLSSKLIVAQAASRGLLSRFMVAMTGTRSLLAGFYIPASASEELPAKLEVGQGSAELLGKTVITIPWISGWSFRKKITLVEQSGGTYNDYPTIITVAYDAHMKNDFADCRFTESDGTTLIPYGIVEKTDGVSCSFVIKRNYTSGCTLTVYLYYGNPDAVDASVDHGPWALDWYLNNGFGQNPSAYTDTNCAAYPHSASEAIPAWADVIFGGCTANGGYRTYYGRVEINGTPVAWASTVVCNGITVAYQLKWKKYFCATSQYDHGSFVAGASNTVTWGHYSGANTGFWVSYYPTDPSVSFGGEAGSESEDLLGKFDVGQGTQDLLARLTVSVPEDSEDLPARLTVRAPNFENLLGKVEVGQGSEDLLARLTVTPLYQNSEDLFGRFEIRQDSEDLLARLHVVQISVVGSGPYTIFDGTHNTITSAEQQRKLFRNPRGQKYYYANLEEPADNYKFYKSFDGSVWSQTGPTVSALNSDLWIYEDSANSRLLVYVLFRNSATGDIDVHCYKIDDGTSDVALLWSDASVVVRGVGETLYYQAITLADDGYLWIVWCVQYSLGGATRWNVYATCTTSTFPLVDPAWEPEIQVFDGSVVTEDTGIIKVEIVPLSATADVAIIWGYYHVTNARYELHGRLGSYAGVDITLGNDVPLSFLLTSGRYFSSVVETGPDSDVFIAYETSTLLARLLKWDISAATAFGDTVYAGNVISICAGIDKASSPDKIYIFYVKAASPDILSYNVTGADVFSLEGEINVDDGTEVIDWLTASYEDWLRPHDLQVAWTRQTSYEARWYSTMGRSSRDLPAKFETARVSDLYAKFVVGIGEGSADLLGKLTVGVLSSSVELLGKLEARHPATTELLGRGDIRQPGSTGISAKTEIRQPGSAELLGKFITKRSTTSEVLGKFVVRHVGISVELICQCMIRHSSIADLFGKVNLTHSVTLLGRFVLRHLAAEELAANVQVCHWEELLGKFRVIHWTRLLGQFTVRHSTATDLSVKFQVAHWERLFTKLWIRHPYRLWTNRHYLNGVVELDEENLSDAFLEYVIQGVMDDVRSWLINEDMLVYDSWTDITETPKLIRRATTYGTVASLYSRDVNDPNSRIVLGLRPMRIRAAEIRSAQERAMDYWESRMEKMMNLYLTSGGRRLMIVDTEDEEAVFSMEDIPFYSADPFKIKVR